MDMHLPSTTMDVSSLGPMKKMLRSTAHELELLDNSEHKHWMCKGKRSLGIAVNLLKQNEIIAVPTDTVYGLACIASDPCSIQRLYKIKGRDVNKPLCISVSSVRDIHIWGVVDHLPPNLLPTILPGPYTVVLKRTPALNSSLNPGMDTVGIRVPMFPFITSISKLVGPLALTSANLSNEPSCLDATEFEQLWPQLGGIFYKQRKKSSIKDEDLRVGSTIVDLSCPGYYKIIRYGVRADSLISLMARRGLKQYGSD